MGEVQIQLVGEAEDQRLVVEEGEGHSVDLAIIEVEVERHIPQ